jgi:hypothetical protein
MRTPLFWLFIWLAASVIVINNWPEKQMWVSAFWIGWSMAIFGQDIADYLKRLSTHERAERIGIWLVRTRFIRRFSVGSLYMTGLSP